MNINASILGQFFVFFVPIMGFLCYYLGKRKTQTPKLTAFLGVLLCFIPPLVLVYIIVLLMKNDIRQADNPG